MAFTTATPLQFIFNGTLTFASVASSATAWIPQTVTIPNGGQFPNINGILTLQLPNLQSSLGFCNVIPLTSTTFQVSFHNPTAGALTPTGTAATLIMN